MKMFLGIVPLAALALTAYAAPPADTGQIPENSFRQGGGSRIAFTRLRENVFPPNAGDFRFDAEIWIMNGDGSEPRRLTINTTDDLGAEWSPDGRTIAFHGAQWGPDSDGKVVHSRARIFFVDAESGTETPLLTDQGEPVLGRWPSWSPDGQRIVFDSGGADANIFVIDRDGGGLEQLTDSSDLPFSSIQPAWSPDGRTIAFVRNFGAGNTQIYVMNADGSDPVPLTDLSTRSSAGPGWSPDGRKISFGSNRSGNGDIYVMNADGTDPRRLTNYLGQDGGATWSPDGRMIAFQRVIHIDTRPRRVNQVFVMSAEGEDADGAAMPLTDLPSESGHPSWSRGRAVKP